MFPLRLTLLSICLLIPFSGSVPGADSVPSVPGAHPRVYVTSATLPAVQARMTDADFSYEAGRVLSSSKPFCKAFVYLTTGDTTKGQEAVTEGLTALEASTDARTMDQPMQFGACIYDWCHDLMTTATRQAYIAEFERIAGLHAPWYPAQANCGAVVGHTTEGWLLTAQLPAGVAIYDESTVMYDAAAAVFFDEFVPVRNYFAASHMHHQGDSYIFARYGHGLLAAWLFRRMADLDAFGEDYGRVPWQLLYNHRPDGQQFRSGDSFDEAGTAPGKAFLARTASALYGDPHLRAYGRSSLFKNPADWLCVFYLLFESDGVVEPPLSEMPTTHFFPHPMGEMVARTGWDFGVDTDTAVVNMRIGHTFFGNHQRKDWGTFQIYYRGPLAISTGVYKTYGADHWKNYHHQTIAHNGLLIYDPSETMKVGSSTVANDGGQRWPNNGADHPKTLDSLLNDGYRMGSVTAHAFGPDPANPAYSYIAGDITQAYTSKVSDVRRFMAAFNTGLTTAPLCFAVFDRVVATDSAFPKTWLIHSIEEPAVSGSRITIQRTGDAYGGGTYDGQLTVDTLLPESPALTRVGGSGYEFWVESVATNYSATKDSPAEPGAWRVEVSPSSRALEDHFFHFMSVQRTGVEPPEILPFVDSSLAGAAARGAACAVVFNRTSETLAAAAFTLPEGMSDTTGVLVCGLEPGAWRIVKPGGGVENQSVMEESGILFFRGGSGAYVLDMTPDAPDVPGAWKVF